jgi:hypothetical protein
MVAEEAPISLRRRGMSGATKLMPKASRNTVNNIGSRPLSITPQQFLAWVPDDLKQSPFCAP